MQKDNFLIKKILEAIEVKVDSEWESTTPKLQGKFGKVTDGGEHEMENATANYDSVKGGPEAKKIETKPSFGKVTNGNAKGGATGVNGQGKPKEVKLEAPEKMNKVMGEFKHGTLKTNAGKKVTNPKQAVAIGYSESKNESVVVDKKQLKEFEQQQQGKILVDLGFLQDSLYNDESIPEELIPTIMSHVNMSVEEEMDEPENLEEISTNVKKLTDRNPAINENNDIKKIEEKLSAENKIKAKKLREAIEKITGKKVVYK